MIERCSLIFCNAYEQEHLGIPKKHKIRQDQILIVTQAGLGAKMYIGDEEKFIKNQPLKIKTSGSTFKNPISQTEKKVWELIKESVPLDQKFGDACISEKHCNFFVNRGNATFKDMSKLIEFVSKKVLEKTGISLEKEIKILE